MLRQMMHLSADASNAEIAQEITARTLDSKPFALFMAGFTAYFTAEKISFIGSIAACILTTVLIFRHSFGLWRDYKKAKREDARSKNEDSETD